MDQAGYRFQRDPDHLLELCQSFCRKEHETWTDEFVREVSGEAIVGLQEATFLSLAQAGFDGELPPLKKCRFSDKPVEDFLPGHTLIGSRSCSAALLVPERHSHSLKWRSDLGQKFEQLVHTSGLVLDKVGVASCNFAQSGKADVFLSRL